MGMVLMCIVVFLVIPFWFGAKVKKGIEQQEEEKRRPDVLAGKIPDKTFEVRSVAGLNIPTNLLGTLDIYIDHMLFTFGGMRYSMNMKQVRNAQQFDDKQLLAFQESSFWGSVLGEAAMGDAGAIIGALPHTKYHEVLDKRNLLITYEDAFGEAKVLVLSLPNKEANAAKAIGKWAVFVEPEPHEQPIIKL